MTPVYQVFIQVLPGLAQFILYQVVRLRCEHSVVVNEVLYVLSVVRVYQASHPLAQGVIRDFI